MPIRMVRDWTDSLKFDGLSAEAERLFVRLIMKADDYGRFHADVRLLKSACFPLSENLHSDAVSGWVDELAKRGLLTIYKVNNRPYLTIPNYGQRLRNSQAKFPEPPEIDSKTARVDTNPPQLAATCRDFRPEEKRVGREEKRGSAAESGKPPLSSESEIPSVSEVVTFGSGMPGIPESYCRDYHAKCSEQHRWVKNQKLINWRNEIIRWWAEDKEKFGKEKNARKPGNQQSVNRNSGTLNDGTADQYRKVGNVV
jgi:hypothetical protein